MTSQSRHHSICRIRMKLTRKSNRLNDYSSIVHAQSRNIDLNAAIFSYLPDAATAIEKLEDIFEQKYSSIDLDLELWNPYDDAFEDDGLSQIVNFVIVEIDTCRIDELMNGAFGGIDKIPTEVLRDSETYVGPAKAIMATDIIT